MAESIYKPKLANSRLFDVKTYKPGLPIEELKRKLGIKSAIKLASNENSFGPSPKAVLAIKKALESINRYPDAGSYYLKNALATKFGVDESRLILGNGSDELIILAIRAFVKAQEHIMIAKPTFLIYAIAAKVQGVKVVEIPVIDFKYDTKGMLSKANRYTRMVFLANPDNPLSTYIPKKDLKYFIDNLSPNCLVFIDEAYYEYATNLKDFPNTKSLLKYPNVILSRTFSKAYGLPGLRVGYAIAHPSVAEAMNKMREPFNVNHLAQVGALAALSDDVFLKSVVRRTNVQKTRLTKFFTNLDFKIIPGATNFIVLHIGDKAADVYQELLKRGVIVRYLGSWGMTEYLRITIGSEKENSILIREFKKILNR
ncbi:MAG: histidinol-phosphate aminotransferase [Candidatus Omnitrophota bacterium]|jgi:histidinol-phosphate aminotransferase